MYDRISIIFIIAVLSAQPMIWCYALITRLMFAWHLHELGERYWWVSIIPFGHYVQKWMCYVPKPLIIASAIFEILAIWLLDLALVVIALVLAAICNYKFCEVEFDYDPKKYAFIPLYKYIVIEKEMYLNVRDTNAGRELRRGSNKRPTGN